MILTKDSPQQYQINHGVNMVRGNQEELGLRFLKAEPLEDVAKAFVQQKLDYEHVYSYYGSAPKYIIPGQQKLLIKVAYEGKYNHEVDHILSEKTWNNLDDSYHSVYRRDKGHNDMRYHAFRAADMEFLVTTPHTLHEGLKDSIVLFRDLDTGRQLVFQSSVVYEKVMR